MDELHSLVAAQLRTIGQRYTAGRKRLVEVLVAAPGPVTIAVIADMASDLPQSSVYRNLTVLEEAQCVRRLAGDDGVSMYEMAEQLTGHHHHLVCTSCGSVADFLVPGPLEVSLGRAMAEVAEGAHFKVESHRLDLIGLCRRCG